MLSGDALWPTVSFRSDVSSYRPFSELDKLSNSEKTLLKKLNLDVGKELSVIYNEALGVNLALQVVPESFRLPSKRVEIADRLLGWLIAGLVEPFSPVGDQSQIWSGHLVKQQDSYREAARVIGQWPSGGARAAATLLLADSYSREAMLTEEYSSTVQ